ncbi:MAG: tetratricopeptide repeat protein [Tannerellaceae bacterium]|jgi:signal transduction histidine kinase|nr:tetratricopeptide repeat protein [Tannerellaceae bacterium]
MRRFRFTLLLFFLLSCGTAFAQASIEDSLLQLLPAAKADTNTVLLYIDIGEHYRKARNWKSAIEYHRKAQGLSRTLHYLHGLYYASDYCSFALNGQGEYDAALAINQEMLDIALNHSDTYQAAIEKWNIGACYVRKGFNETALSYFMDALACFENEDYRSETGGIYNQILSVYARMNRYEDAIPYGEKALAMRSDTISSSFGIILLNLSVCYHNLNPPQNEKAMEYLQKTLRIATHNHNSALEFEVYLNIGNIHFSNNRIAESETYYRKALSFFSEDAFPAGFCIANIGLAKIAMFRNNFAEAEAMAQHNLEIARRHGIRLEEKNNLSFLWELSAAKHDWEGRLRYKAAFDSVQNLVVNETMLRAAEELEVKYETEKKEMQITTLEEEKRLMIWFSIATGAVLLLALTAFFFLWRWTVQKKRLAESQRELAEQHVKQLEQEKQLIATQAVLDGEVQERIRLARDLHDSLGSMLAAAKYQLLAIRQIAILGDEDVECYNKAASLLDDSMTEMRRVAHHLMPDALSRFGLKPAIGDFCDTLPSVQFVWYGDESRLDPKLEEVVYRIAHELISNALKHSGAQHILVQIVQEPSRIALVVQDDGSGFDPSDVSRGMGLSNIRIRVASFGGSINIDSKKDEGTEINIEFRVKS